MSLRYSNDSNFVFDDASYNDLELVHFRLTDSALKDIEQLASTLGNHSFSITFSGSEGSFIVPIGKNSSKFTFSTSSLTSTHDESFNCLRTKGVSTNCLGKMVSRITVNAKEDSFSAAKERMTQLEDENKKSQTKEIKSAKSMASRTAVPQSAHKQGSHGVNLKGKGNEVSPQNIDFPNVANRVQSQNPVGCGPSPPLPNPDVLARSLRERIIHILALRPYQRPELLLRLSRDGLSHTQKEQISDILSSVGRVGRQSAYYLIPSVVSELDANWPGYTGAERRRIISLKTSQQSQTPPKSPTDRSRTASPDNSSTPSDDQFTRRPTRANAPSAPHALSKKIAALDMLCAGVSDVEVAARLGVFRGLLDQWRANESELREKFRRLNANTNSVPSTQISSLNQHSQVYDKSVNVRHQNPTTSTANDVVGSQRSTSINPGNTISPHKRAKLDVPNTPSSTDQQMDLTYSTSDKTVSRSSVLHSFPNQNNDDHNNQTNAISPPLHDNLHTLDTYSRSNQPCTYNIAGGSEGESAEHTPFSNSSTGSSGYGGSNNGLTASSGVVNSSINVDNRREGLIGSTSRCHLTMSVHSECLSSRLKAEDQLSNGNTTNTPAYGVTEPALSQSIVGTDGFHIGDLSSKLAEIDRLYPEISTSEQASMYLAEFECTYPTYLRMYHSFSDIWKTVSNLRSQLLEATRTEGFDSATTTHLANQLDKFIRRSRSQKYRDDEIQLTLMVHKLRLLKQRLAVSQHNNNGGRHRDRILPVTTNGDVTGDKIDRLSRCNNNNMKSISMKSSFNKISSMSNNNITQSSDNNENKNNNRLMNNCHRQLLTDSSDYSNLLPCNQV
uniref:Ell related n=1 Tax=Schistosoma mansoni TaxID=6183 RepID=A0A3Q0KJ53_SCHMA